jgi:hypothetical protein
MGKARKRKQTAREDGKGGARKPEPAPAPVPTPRAATALWYLGGLLCFWSFGYTQMMGSDFFWHLASGRWMVEHRTFFNLTDPWSFTFGGKPWLEHEWLSDVIYYAWASLFGQRAIVYWKWVVVIATYTLFMHALRRSTQSSAAAFLAVLAALAVGAPFIDVRPHLYTLLGLAVTTELTIARPRPSAWLPLVFLVWANLHGGFFFGLMALAALLSPWVLGGPRPERLRALAIWGLAAVACLLTPNGASGWLYPIKYAFDSTSPFRTLGEWHPPFQPGGIRAPLYPHALVLLGVTTLLVLAVRKLRNDLRVSIAGLGLSALTLAMSLRSRRFIPIFGMSEALIVAPTLAFFLGLWPAATRGTARWRPYLAPALALGLGLYWMSPLPLGTAAYRSLVDLRAFPVELMDYIQDHQVSGKVFAYYNWGGYIHLKTDGRLQVYIDGRADTLYDAETYNRYVQVLSMRPGWMDVVEKSGAELVLWPKREGGVLRELVRTGRWRVLAEDPVGQLLIRSSAT